jgi:hypothetical protein
MKEHLSQKNQFVSERLNAKFENLSNIFNLSFIHLDYAEQLLCQSYLSCLIEHVIRNDALSTIIDRDQQQGKIVEPWIDSTILYFKIFPRLHKIVDDKSH